MKNAVLLLSMFLFLLPSVVMANPRPSVAVIVSGHSDPNVNNVLSIDMTRAFVQTEQFSETPRKEEFLAAVTAESQRQAITDGMIAAIARRLGIQRVCIVSMSSILGSYYISAKIIDSETGVSVANGEIDNMLATLADIRNASAELVGAMVGRTPAQQTQQVQTFNQQQQFQQIEPQFQQPQFNQSQQQMQQQIIPTQTANMQVIQLQPGQQILIVGSGAQQQNFIPQQQTLNLQQQQLETNVSSGRTWKERWIYVGGSFGVGWIAFEHLDYSETFTSLNAIADFPLLAPVVSLETQLTLGNEESGVSPLLRIGYISEPFEITFDAGTFIGSEFGIPLSATVGFKVGPGMAFARYQIIGSEWFYIHVISAGYKIGVGPRRGQ